MATVCDEKKPSDQEAAINATDDLAEKLLELWDSCGTHIHKRQVDVGRFRPQQSPKPPHVVVKGRKKGEGGRRRAQGASAAPFQNSEEDVDDTASHHTEQKETLQKGVTTSEDHTDNNQHPEESSKGLDASGSSNEGTQNLAAFRNSVTQWKAVRTRFEKEKEYSRQNIQEIFVEVMASAAATFKQAPSNQKVVPQMLVTHLVVMVIQTRDCRSDGVGRGNVENALELLLLVARVLPKTIFALLDLLPKYGCWKDLNRLMIMLTHALNDSSVSGKRNPHRSLLPVAPPLDRFLAHALLEKLYSIYSLQLQIDTSSMQASGWSPAAWHTLSAAEQQKATLPTISLAAKWAPKEGKECDRKTGAVREIASRMFPKMKDPVIPKRVKLMVEQEEQNKKEDGGSEAPAAADSSSAAPSTAAAPSSSATARKSKMGYKGHWVKDRRIKEYQRLLAQLNLVLATTENLMSNAHWDFIACKKIPSGSIRRYWQAFSRPNSQRMVAEKVRGGDARERFTKRFIEFCMEGSHLKKRGKEAGGLLIHELVRDCKDNNGLKAVVAEHLWKGQVAHYRELVEKAIAKAGTNDGEQVPECPLANSLVIADVSGSMTVDSGTPLNLSIAMAILVSSLQLVGPFQNQFISFASVPAFCDLRSVKDDLKSSINVVMQSPVGYSTDFIRAFGLILSTATKSKLKPEELPQTVFVVSDMMFNEAASDFNLGLGAKDLLLCQSVVDVASEVGITIEDVKNCFPPQSDTSVATPQKNDEHSSQPIDGYAGSTIGVTMRNTKWNEHHHVLKAMFAAAGIKHIGVPYPLPKLIYWNARSSYGKKMRPVTADEEGAQFVSGFSASLLKLFLDGGSIKAEAGEPDDTPGQTEQTRQSLETPWDTFLKAMNHEFYREVVELVNRVGETLSLEEIEKFCAAAKVSCHA